MLYLYQSNRLEDLAALLAKVHTLNPPQGIFTAEEVVVQSQGMRRFLNRFLAERHGIAANLHYSLPAGFTWQLMRRVLPDLPALSPFAPEVVRWRLLAYFSDGLNEAPAARAALGSYLAGGETAAYQLAGQLADIFDQYLVYRPDWMDAWQQGRLLQLGDDEVWQAELWRLLDDGRYRAPHRVAMWRQLLSSLDAGRLPRRLFVFGIATLAPMYLELLQAAARHCEVHIFALNPGDGYWGNLMDPAQMLHSGTHDMEYGGHPLLASLGKQGRDFFHALAESEAVLELPVYTEQPDDSLLHRLQNDIQNLRLPHNSGQGPDASVRIVSAHSPLRELQILKDYLLHLLHEHPDWQPHDIAVLTPHIEPYSPFIDAVFGQEQEGSRRLPYSLSDVKISRRQPFLQALEQILGLFDSRFEVGLVLELLENETVLRRFGLERDDLPLLHDTVAALNIRWGSDETMRGGDSLFTWQQGLDRIVLGWLLPQGQDLWQQHSPWFTAPNHTETLARFTAFVRTLAVQQRIWQQAGTVAEWTARTRALTEVLLADGEGDQAAVQQLNQSLNRWQEEADLAAFGGSLPPAAALAHIGRFLQGSSESGLLAGGITFCGMVPMRSLPFKVICLIGLNDGDFPRNTRAAAFDLIARHPRRGDRARRDDDRYLFLEALMSARERLYLSYVGRSVRNNDALAPSALIDELTDTVAQMCGMPSETLRREWVEQHPLQPFSRRYFDAAAPVSARSDYTRALNQPPQAVRPFLENPLPEAAMPSEIAQEDFLSFWRNPLRYWLKQRLNWRPPYAEEAADAAEPFTPPHEAAVAEAYLYARRDREDFARTAERLSAQSMLPAGELGVIYRRRYEAAAKSLDGTLLDSPPLAGVPYSLQWESGRLNGTLDSLHRDGRIRLSAVAPNGPQRIVFLLEHLLFNAVRPPQAAGYDSHWIQPDGGFRLAALGQQQAHNLLRPWLDYYRLGQRQPLPFFPKVCLAAAEAALKGSSKTDPRERAGKAAADAYYGSKFSTGVRDYPEVALAFGRDAEAPVDGALFWNLIDDLLLPLLTAVGTDQADGGTP